MSHESLTRADIARIAAADIPEGACVNLGIGLPTQIADFIGSREVLLQSEQGLLGLGPKPEPGEEDWDVVNAGKFPVTLLRGASVFSHSDSFLMIRGGHIDIACLGAKGCIAPMHHAAVYWRKLFKENEQPVNGRIINTTSASGVWGNIGQINYGGAKAGIASMTIIAARELKRYGVTVNAICPHAVTRMTSELRERTAEQLEKGDPKWIAPVVAWLASLDSANVTGRVIEAGGGHLSVLEGWCRGPKAEPVASVAEVGALLKDMVPRARLNAGMNGEELD